MNQQAPQHLLEGATLGTEDRGDIVIRSKAGDLLYRFVPIASRQDEPLLAVLRSAHFHAEHFAKARRAEIPASAPAQAQQLLVRLQEMVSGMQKSFDRIQDDQGADMLRTLDDAKALARDAGPIIAALSIPQSND